jgi:Holliday junction resolvasome RuvABC endonuclease subunit
MGIDPGVKGVLAVIDRNGRPVYVKRQPLIGGTEDVHGMATAVTFKSSSLIRAAYIEKMFTGPMNRTSAAVLGKLCGIWIGLLTANRIPFFEVRPQDWQSQFIQGRKANTKPSEQYTIVAHRMWPALVDSGCNFDDNVAAALLMAEFARRQDASARVAG